MLLKSHYKSMLLRETYNFTNYFHQIPSPITKLYHALFSPRVHVFFRESEKEEEDELSEAVDR